MDYRGLATDALKIGAWVLLVCGGLLVLFMLFMNLPSPTDAYGMPTAEARLYSAVRIGVIVGTAANTILGWAVCLVLSEVSQESRETHHEIKRAMQ